MENTNDTLEPFFEDFVFERVECLTRLAEKSSEYQKEREEMQKLIDKAEKVMDRMEVGMLISATKSIDSIIQNYIYCAAVRDGIQIAGMIDRIRNESK